MHIKSLLLGSAAALAAVSGAQAADAIVAAEPEPMEYVRVCDAFGTGYFYIPGTETCLKVGGRVRFDAQYGSVYDADADGTYTNTRAEIYLDSASDTEWGALKTSIVARFDYDPHNDDANGGAFNDATRTRLMQATISLGGFTAGLQDSLYESFINYAGDVENDDVINYGPSEVNQLSYTFDAGNGFSAFVALEDDGQNDDDVPGHASDWVNVSGGVKYDTGTLMIGLTGGYDESMEEGAIKAKISGNFGAFNAFVMGGWNTDGDSFNDYAPEVAGTDGEGWGDYALWAGAGYKFSDTLAANVQVSYADIDVFSAAANLQWTPVSGLLIQPEIAYTNWDTATVNDDAFSGMLRFQRTF
ncbi:Porin subfamily protein [Rhizobium sp. NFR07]|uniref:porin n=1 Tax=Rhizobium sp. NFR07 TaxID=1566262 RepID=UPI0008E0861E|nr:porin [Rhizobium sp. NFR07]SFB58598.1 Porin subfamily protein [Rhizobium sp. NFR07]